MFLLRLGLLHRTLSFLLSVTHGRAPSGSRSLSFRDHWENFPYDPSKKQKPPVD